jgi:hypothetical protein
VGKSEKAEKQRSTAGRDKRPVGRIRNLPLPSPLSPWRPSRLGGKSSSPYPKSAFRSQQSAIRSQEERIPQSPIINHQSLPPSAYRTKIHIANRRVIRDIHLMIAQTEIRKLPLSEKLDLLESVWSELSSDPDAVDVPQWHKYILDERQRGMEQGSIKVIDWDLAKEQIRHRIL